MGVIVLNFSKQMINYIFINIKIFKASVEIVTSSMSRIYEQDRVVNNIDLD